MQFVQIFPLILLVSFVNSFRPPLRSSSRAMRRKTQREQKRIEQIERSRKCYYTERIYSNECPNLLINYKNRGSLFDCVLHIFKDQPTQSTVINLAVVLSRQIDY